MKTYKGHVNLNDTCWDIPVLIQANSEDEAIAIIATEYALTEEVITVWEV